MKVHKQRDILQMQVMIYRAGIRNIYRYLNSEKFFVDPSVNKSDIFQRLEDIQTDLNELEHIVKKESEAIQ